MKAVAARVDDETLDAIQRVRGRVPISEFRFLPECDGCQKLVAAPVGLANVSDIYAHIQAAHSAEVLS